MQCLSKVKLIGGRGAKIKFFKEVAKLSKKILGF